MSCGVVPVNMTMLCMSCSEVSMPERDGWTERMKNVKKYEYGLVAGEES